MTDKKGLVIIYTGEGKGKTTAALGLVLRAVGYQKKCLIIQFGKNSFSGEIRSLKLLKTVKVIQGGKGFVKILGDKLALKEHKKAAQKTFDTLYNEVVKNIWDLVVADEIVGAVSSGLLPENLVIKLVKDKPESLDLVLTGHHAPKKIIEMADLVTEMQEVKHPYQKKVKAKKGLDF